MPTADLANFFSTYAGGRFQGNFNNQLSQMSSLFGLPPVAGAGGIGQLPIGALTAAVTNGKSPAYAFKVFLNKNCFTF